eukprot:4734458-Prymnesium_polylepis.1
MGSESAWARCVAKSETSATEAPINRAQARGSCSKRLAALGLSVVAAEDHLVVNRAPVFWVVIGCISPTLWHSSDSGGRTFLTYPPYVYAKDPRANTGTLRV